MKTLENLWNNVPINNLQALEISAFRSKLHDSNLPPHCPFPLIHIFSLTIHKIPKHKRSQKPKPETYRQKL